MTRSRFSPQDLKPLLAGVINMHFTPFNAAGDLDETALCAHTHFMTESGIVAGRGVQVVGAQAGQGYYLSDGEYRRLISLVVQAAGGRVPVGVGCIRPATKAVIELAQAAEAAGADFVLVMPPYYLPQRPCSREKVLEHYHALAAAIDIAIMVHNSPNSAGQSLSFEVLSELAAIEKIVAYKEDRQDFGGLRELVYRFKDRFMINANSYKALIPLDYQTGLTGYNSFLANVDPAYALRQHDLALSGNFAACHAFWAKALDLYDYMLHQREFTFDELGKEMARLAGRNMGCCERLPLRRPGEPERQQLRRLMQQVGMPVAATISERAPI
jgi:4-hydroxy-tetrahydrodipicolinate synthase